MKSFLLSVTLKYSTKKPFSFVSDLLINKSGLFNLVSLSDSFNLQILIFSWSPDNKISGTFNPLTDSGLVKLG